MNNMVKWSPFSKTDLGLKFGDLEILFGMSGKGGELRANSLILDGPQKIIVDPAGGEDHHHILAKENPILFFTHYHGDHRMSEHCYSEDSTVWATEEDSEALESIEACAKKIGGENSKQIEMMLVGMQQFMKLRDWNIARTFKDGDILEAGGCQAELVHLPGHTPGHTGLFFPEQSLLFTTDIDLTAFGPWYGNVVSDLNQFKESIQKARNFECDWYYTSHGEMIIGREECLAKLDDFEAHFARRDALILETLQSAETSIDDLSHIGLCYRSETLKKMPHMINMEKLHVQYHLLDLIERGLVSGDEDFKRFALKS